MPPVTAQPPRNAARLLGPVDLVVVIALVALAVAFLPYSRAHAPALAVVYRDNTEVARYPLDTPAQTTIPGESGGLVLRIADGTARVVSSACPNHICVASGAVRRPGQQIVCAPNHVAVQIITNREGAPDAVTR